MDTKALCPICGEGRVTARQREVEIEYKGRTARLPVHYQLCDTCTSDYMGAAESRLNKRVVMAFRKRVDGLLTGEEITALRKQQYQITQTQAAKLFGGGPVAFSKYENDDVAQSEAMDTLLRLVRRSSVAFWALVEEKGMQDEFTQMRPRIHVPAQTNVVCLADFRPGAEQSDPRYSPRQYRESSSVELPCRN